MTRRFYWKHIGRVPPIVECGGGPAAEPILKIVIKMTPEAI